MKMKFLSFLCGLIIMILGVIQAMAQGSVEFRGSVGSSERNTGGGSSDRNWNDPGRNHGSGRDTREQAERAAKEQADRDRVAKEQADRDRLAKERAVREQADRERIARDIKHDKFISDVKVNRDKLNLELQNGMQHLAIKKDGLEMFQSFRKDLNSDKNWHGGDLRLVTGMLASSARSISKMTADILVVSEQYMTQNRGMLVAAIAAGSEIIQKTIEDETLNAKQIDEYLKSTLLKDQFSKGEPVIALALSIIQRMEDISVMSQLPVSQRKLKKEIDDQLRKLEKEIKKYEVEIAKSEAVVSERKLIIGILNGVLEAERLRNNIH